MLLVAPKAIDHRAATDAEALARSFQLRGARLFILVDADGHPRLVIDPWLAAHLSSGAQVVRDLVPLNRRFHADPRFARELFGHLDVEGRVYTPRPARGFHINFD